MTLRQVRCHQVPCALGWEGGGGGTHFLGVYLMPGPGLVRGTHSLELPHMEALASDGALSCRHRHPSLQASSMGMGDRVVPMETGCFGTSKSGGSQRAALPPSLIKAAVSLNTLPRCLGFLHHGRAAAQRRVLASRVQLQNRGRGGLPPQGCTSHAWLRTFSSPILPPRFLCSLPTWPRRPVAAASWRRSHRGQAGWVHSVPI